MFVEVCRIVWTCKEHDRREGRLSGRPFFFLFCPCFWFVRYLNSCMFAVLSRNSLVKKNSLW